jgi:hypothetical protein
MTKDHEIIMRDEIRNAWPDQYMKIVDMVRENIIQTKEYS